MDKLLVTIGIPFYNSAAYLDFAIKSVINQTYKNWELILIDDGSSDNSLNIIDKYYKIDNRIRVISDGQNLGLPTRLNQLSKEAKGYYYARMDADDIMHPNRINYQLNFLKRNPAIDLIGTSLISIDNENNIIGIRNNFKETDFGLKRLLKGTWCVHPTIMGKTSWFLQNPYNQNLKRAQDYELWIRSISVSKFYRDDLPLLFYRENSTPSLYKYFVNTKFTLITFLINRKTIGFFNVAIFSIKKIIKLSIYIMFFLIGQSDYLINRRSIKLSCSESEEYQKKLEIAIKR